MAYIVLSLLNVAYIVLWLLNVVLWGVIFAILWWAKDNIPFIAPFKMIVQTVLVIAFVLVAIGLLTGSIGILPILLKLGV